MRDARVPDRVGGGARKQRLAHLLPPHSDRTPLAVLGVAVTIVVDRMGTQQPTEPVGERFLHYQRR
jgi:hypothetical protein